MSSENTLDEEQQMSNSTSRRSFLKGTIATTAVGLASSTPLVSNSHVILLEREYDPIYMYDLFMSSTNTSPKELVFFNKSDTFHRGKANQLAYGSLASTFIRYLGKFATQVGVKLVSNLIYDWYKERASSEQQKIDYANKRMKQANYTDYGGSAVYSSKGKGAVYGVANSDKRNICAAFYPLKYSTISNPMLLEAPTIGALYGASYDWSSRKISKEDGLVPISKIEGFSPQLEESNMRSPLFLATKAGWVGMAYEPASKRESSSGKLLVAAAETTGYQNDNIIFEETYNVSW